MLTVRFLVLLRMGFVNGWFCGTRAYNFSGQEGEEITLVVIVWTGRCLIGAGFRLERATAALDHSIGQAQLTCPILTPARDSGANSDVVRQRGPVCPSQAES